MKEPIKFGSYHLFDRVAVGGMAEVFKAATYGVESFERFVAIKRVLPSIAQDQEFIDMFVDEAKIAVQLAHSNIGKVFELGQVGEAYFISMEFVSGRDTRAIFDRIRSRGERLNIAMCCHIVKEVCEALEYAHNKKNAAGQPLDLIHRDVSPQNILVSYDGEVKLIDFGIAKAAGKANKTQAGILKGKFGYMSPEQVRGKPIDGRSDIFSLATVLYELLTLERCFQGVDDFSTLEKLRKVDFRRPTLLNREIPPELERIIYRGLTRNPADRFQSAAEFQEALQRFLYQSGSFYSRKDLSSFMTTTFARELAAENEKTEAFRTYSRAHRLHEGSLDEVPEVSVSFASAPGSTASQSGSLDWGPTSDVDSIGVIDRTTEQESESDQTLPGGGAAFPEDAPTIPRRPKPIADAPPDTTRRLTWLIIVTIFALVAGGITIHYALESMAPGTALITIRTPTDQVINHIEIFDDADDRVIYSGQPPQNPPGLQLEPGIEHQLRIEVDGYRASFKEVTLNPGEVKRYEFNLVSLSEEMVNSELTKLTIDSDPPGAMVYIDGRPTQSRGTPLVEYNVEPGPLRVRITKPAYIDHVVTYQIENAPDALVKVTLKPVQIDITIIAEPENATISTRRAGGTWQKKGLMPVTVKSVDNLKGLDIRVEADGFNPQQRNIREAESEHVRAEFQLKPVEIEAVKTRTSMTGRAQKRSRNQKRGASPTGKASTKPLRKKTSRAPATKKLPKFCRREASQWPMLSINSRPAGRIYVDGADLGDTPKLNHQVTEGQHSVLLLIPSGNSVRRDSFDVHVGAGDKVICIYER